MFIMIGDIVHDETDCANLMETWMSVIRSASGKLKEVQNQRHTKLGSATGKLSSGDQAQLERLGEQENRLGSQVKNAETNYDFWKNLLAIFMKKRKTPGEILAMQ